MQILDYNKANFSFRNKNRDVFDIIIPLKDQTDYLDRCLKSIKKNTVDDYMVYIIDDRSIDPITEIYLKRINNSKIKVIKNNNITGFSGTINFGLVNSYGNIVCLLNSDTEIGTYGWNKRMADVFNSDNKTAVVGLLSNNAVNQSILPENTLRKNITIDEIGIMVIDKSEKRYPLYNLPTGFCYTIKREFIAKIGILDEVDFPHYGSEDDFSLRVKNAGFNCRIADDVFVYHKADQSYNKRNDLRKNAGVKFIKKYGDIQKLADADLESLKYIRNKMINYTIEIPFDDTISGGIQRHKKLAELLYTIEIPSYHKFTGGLNDMICIVPELYNSHLRIQRQHATTDYSKIDFKVPYSVGFPDSTFPDSKYVITYSDTTHLNELLALPQVDKVGVYMLSYGMMLERERANAFNKNAVCMASTKRTMDLINWDGGDCKYVGFGLDIEDFYDENNTNRAKYITVLAHNNIDKRYEQAMKIAARLVDDKFADGIVTFGVYGGNKKFPHHIKHHEKVSHPEIRKIFNNSICFIMPSITEGLNLTPIEATLCKCPAVLCDGAINELYFDDFTCRIARKDDEEDIYEKAKYIIKNYSTISQRYFDNMNIVKTKYTWQNVVNNIRKYMEK
jgi:GT2 family glycosyltransferase